MAKKLSLRQVRNEKQVCSLRRDHYNVGDWSIMTDGYRVWISRQALGKERTDHIEIPKSVFDKLCDDYRAPQPVGIWRGDRFKPAA